MCVDGGSATTRPLRLAAMFATFADSMLDMQCCAGWNKPDETFIRQLHKWLELTFVEGCRAQVRGRGGG